VIVCEVVLVHCLSALHGLVWKIAQLVCTAGWPLEVVPEDAQGMIISVVHLTLDGVNGKWRWRQIDGENSKLRRQSSEFSDGNAVIYDRNLRCHFWMTPYVHNTDDNSIKSSHTLFSFVWCLQVLFTPLPPMLFVPAKIDDFKDSPHYACPLYKTSERRGVSNKHNITNVTYKKNIAYSVQIPASVWEVIWIDPLMKLTNALQRHGLCPLLCSKWLCMGCICMYAFYMNVTSLSRCCVHHCPIYLCVVCVSYLGKCKCSLDTTMRTFKRSMRTPTCLTPSHSGAFHHRPLDKFCVWHPSTQWTTTSSLGYERLCRTDQFRCLMWLSMLVVLFRILFSNLSCVLSFS